MTLLSSFRHPFRLGAALTVHWRRCEQTAAGARPRLQSTDVAAAVTPFVAGSAGSRFESLEVLRAESTDGRSATVELAAYWRPPVLSLLVPEGLRIEVTAKARSVFD